MFSPKYASLVVGTLLAVTACAPAAPTEPPAVDTAADEAALRAADVAWVEGYNSGDVETMVALYADDGVLMPPHAPAAYGHPAIQAFLAADTAAARAAGVTLALGAGMARVSGDMGVASGSFTATDASGAVVDSGSYLSMSRKVDGKWLYVRDMYNSDRPLPAAAPAMPGK